MASLDISADDASVKATTLVAAATGASTGSDSFLVPEGAQQVIFSEVLGAGETVGLEIQDPAGNWIGIAAGFLTETNNAETILGKGVYRVTKSVTASATGVYTYGISFKRKGY